MSQPHSHTTWEAVYEPTSFPGHVVASVWANLIPRPCGRQCMSHVGSQNAAVCALQQTTLVIEWWEDSRNNTTLHKMFNSSFFVHIVSWSTFIEERKSPWDVSFSACLPLQLGEPIRRDGWSVGALLHVSQGQHSNIRQSCWKSLQSNLVLLDSGFSPSYHVWVKAEECEIEMQWI